MFAGNVRIQGRLVQKVNEIVQSFTAYLRMWAIFYNTAWETRSNLLNRIYYVRRLLAAFE